MRYCVEEVGDCGHAGCRATVSLSVRAGDDVVVFCAVLRGLLGKSVCLEIRGSRGGGWGRHGGAVWNTTVKMKERQGLRMRWQFSMHSREKEGKEEKAGRRKRCQIWPCTHDDSMMQLAVSERGGARGGWAGPRLQLGRL